MKNTKFAPKTSSPVIVDSAAAYGYPSVSVDALGFMQIADVRILAAVARGEIDLNLVARRELALRGLDHNGAWIGFEQAAALAPLPVARKK